MANTIEIVKSQTCLLSELGECESFMYNGNLHINTGYFIDTGSYDDSGHVVLSVVADGFESLTLDGNTRVTKCIVEMNVKVTT